MERILLGLLCLSGWHFTSCLPHQYHYESEEKTWTEAQTFCRETYTDLVTVKSAEEVKQVLDTVAAHGNDNMYWIGVYTKIEWKWSDGYTASGADYMNWETIEDNEPDFYSGEQFCVDIEHDGKWWDYDCLNKLPFFCYRGTPQDPEFVFVQESMSWSDAQRFCRENYIDLATVRNSTENQRLHNTRPNSDWTWIGLYRDPNIHWSDGSDSALTFWINGNNPLGNRRVMCGAGEVVYSGEWWALPCEEKYPFMCYSSGKNHVITQEIKTEDPSVDMNNPAVRAVILRELQNRLEENGLSGVTLKWRVQPDGKVFHKNEQSSPKKWSQETEVCKNVKFLSVAEPKTWTEAQTFCRETYTDLVTVKSAEEVKQVLATAVAHGNNKAFWIGVYIKIEWKWSDGYTASGGEYMNWENIKDNEPDFSGGGQYCVEIEDDGKWWDFDCLKKLPFICYRGTPQDPEFVFVQERMNWFDAQRFCRENYIDLATVRNSTENQKLHNTRPNSDWAWIGLYREPNTHWSDGSDSALTFWSGSNPLGNRNVMCGAGAVSTSGEWWALPCEWTFPSVCYSSEWIFTSCLAHQYHFVAEPKAWTEAQTFCRETYTDLVTVKSAEEVKQVLATAVAHGYNSLVWIGLYTNIEWKWSDGYTASGPKYMNWENVKDNEPDFSSGNQFCVVVTDDGRWWDDLCFEELTVMCNRADTPHDPEFVFVRERMNWFDAQRFCRKNYKDLATVRNGTENQKLQSVIPDEYYPWIGLYRDPNIHWSDGSDSSFQFWDFGSNQLGSRSLVCGAAAVWNSGKWWALPCEEKHPFVCYSSGWHFTSCLPHLYHYVFEPKTWTEAQTFCREKYTDLVTVKSAEEVKQFLAIAVAHGNNEAFWIGVYMKIEWKWSDGYTVSGAEYMNWENIEDNEPDFHAGEQFCVDIEDDGKWWDMVCLDKLPFICYRGTPQDPEFVFVQESMSWSDAQRFCRENYIDLATVRNSTENQRLHNARPNSDWAWIGLYRDSNIHWSDGSDSMHQFWFGAVPLGNMSVICGAGAIVNSGTWWGLSCEDKYQFICYSSVAKLVITQEIKTEDPSVDMNNPAVRADILRERQNRLEENGLSGVTLKWRVQPDGKVFHKKEKSSPKKCSQETNVCSVSQVLLT
ncbi:secretory phospholipase A2 receptor-like [Xyrichtys novacula]|uniref:Secretory phospholipase A2 receptor-like n=1 Tax=Xyrichtys novacula TaxID=13765 RepID=A0AAV1HPE6_XYRNO|nr:secretory phospholipase A2 receptor-like [Xyrichtys novacula]